jgi:hypothetical protein
MNDILRLGMVLLVAGLAGCATLPDQPIPQWPNESPEMAAMPLANCVPPMDDPDYWIIKFPQPDRVLLTPRQIEQLNQSNLTRGFSNDVLSDKVWSEQPRDVEHQDEDSNNNSNPGASCSVFIRPGFLTRNVLTAYLKEETDRIRRSPRWDEYGRKVPNEVLQALDDNLNLQAVQDENPIYYGIMRRRADFRYYPTKAILKIVPSRYEFDGIQVSAVQAYQPLAILHTSRDGKWCFVIAPACRGWVPKEDLVVCQDREELASWMTPAQRLVVVGHSVPVVAEPGNTITVERFYMGTACPLVSIEPLYYKIALPDSDGNSRLAQKYAYVSRLEAVSEGFIPCTIRNVYSQAFRVLHTPYSWGGQGEYRDCSQLVMDVYACMGLVLPRNSGYQGRVGNKIIKFTRKQKAPFRMTQLKKVDRPALLQFPGHVMLYLGREGNHYYAIHDIWSFRKPLTSSQDRKVIIGKVVVSDLSLGESSTKGTLLERITVVNTLQP